MCMNQNSFRLKYLYLWFCKSATFLLFGTRAQEIMNVVLYLMEILLRHKLVSSFNTKSVKVEVWIQPSNDYSLFINDKCVQHVQQVSPKSNYDEFYEEEMEASEPNWHWFYLAECGVWHIFEVSFLN